MSYVSWLWHNKDSDTSVWNDMFIPNGGKLQEVYRVINFGNIVTLSHDERSQLYDTIHYISTLKKDNF